MPLGHSLSIQNLEIILFKTQLLQFPMHSLRNFSYKTYHLKCLSAPEALVNISHNIFDTYVYNKIKYIRYSINLKIVFLLISVIEESVLV